MGNGWAGLHGDRRVYGLIAAPIVIAAMLRLGFAPFAYAHHSDAIWQYIEPPYRLLTSHGLITWEQRAGMRSWLVPAILTGPTYLGLTLDPDGTSHVLAIRLVSAAVSLILLFAFFRLGKQFSTMHALIALGIAAIWSEFIFMAPQPLTEAISAPAFMCGAALLLCDGKRFRLALLAGFLLGLSAFIRLQHAPAMFVLLVLALGRYRLLPVGIGGVCALLLDSAVNLALGQMPLEWIWLNFEQNLLENRSAGYGVQPVWAYAADFLLRYNFFLLPGLILAFVGARRFPALAVAAIVNFLLFSLIPHKEWRFQYLTIVIFIALASVGTGDLVQRPSGSRWRRQALALVAAGWLVASLGAMLSPRVPPSRDFDLRGIELAMARVADTDASCAIGVVGQSHAIGGSYALLNRDRDLFYFRGELAPGFARHAYALGAVVTERAFLPALPPRFGQVECLSGTRENGICIARSRSACRGAIPSRFEINRAIRDLGI